MKLDVSIRSSDLNIGKEIRGQIADGITIERKKRLAEAVGVHFLDYIIVAAEGIAITVAAILIANYLYDKLKGTKDANLTINYKSVEINAKKIEQLIINIEKEKKD
jgi:uncharacterized membrane protein required for colicin V production